METKNIQLERLIFFCDAVVAIAITLLALDLKIEPTSTGHLTFSDIREQWKTFAAFSLSFANIASFWKTHRLFFTYIKEVDEKSLWYNVLWLFFVVILPFSTSLVSSYFFDTPAIFIYSLNTFFIVLFQNFIWDHASFEYKYVRPEAINSATISRIRIFCNLDMVNAVLAIGISFISPSAAFIVLLTKFPMIVITGLFYKPTRDEETVNRDINY